MLVAVVACVADAGPMGPPAPVATVTVNPGATALTVGATQQFSATLRDSTGAILTGRSVSWSSLNLAVATVGPNGMATGQSVGSTSIRATSEGKLGDATLAVASPPPTLVRVILTPDTIVIFTGATRQFTAMGRMSDSTTVAITATFGANGGNVTGAGLYTAGPAAGTFRVIAAAQGKADTSAVTIQLAPVASVTVVPSSQTIAVAGTVQLVATPRDAGGNALTGRVVTWQTSNPTIASVSGGLVTGQAAGGPVTITASSEGHDGTASITVSASAPTLVRVILSPDSATVFTGATQAFTTTGRMSDSTNVPLAPTYSATGGSINSSGVYTAGSTTGLFRVIASSSGKADTSPVVIQPRPVATVTLTPASATIGIAGTVQLTATLRDAQGNVLTGRVVTWQTSNPTVASVSGGLVTGQQAGGPVTITANCEGQNGTASITVSAPAPTLVRVTLTPPSATLFTADTVRFTTTARMSDSSDVIITPTYTSTGGSTSASGLYTAGATAGSFRVIASSAGKADTSPVTIQLRPVATVTLTPAVDTIPIAGTVTLTATLRDAQGNILTGRPITWGTLNGSIASVVAGLVTGVAVDTTQITATSEGQADTSTIMVIVVPPSTIDTLFVDGFESGNLNAWDDRYESQRQTVQTNAGAHAGSRYLQLEYPSGADGGGAVTKFFGFGFPTGNNTGGYDKLYVRYWVKFPSNWQGGTKLLLLRGSRTDNQWSSFGVAGQCPNGTNFFATNVVTLNQSTLPLRFYSYYVGMARESDGVTCYGRHGNNEDPGGTPNPAATYFASLDVSKNVWHMVEFEVTLNTPGQSNGVQRFWLDGVLKGEWSGLNFRTQSVLKLNALTLEASMNGPNSSPQTQTLSIDDVLVATGRP